MGSITQPNQPQWLALYAAIVGTAGFLLSLYLAFRDRAKVEVFAGPDDPARADVHPPIDGASRILVHVRNRGRRTVTLERIWYTRRSTGDVRHLLTDRYDQGPEVIHEGESTIHELYFWDVTPEDLGHIVVEAQDGRKWRGKYRSGLKPPRWNKA
jgi:hypothetical protein